MLLDEELKDYEGVSAEKAGRKLVSFIKENEVIGDLLSLDYTEAIVLVHDSLRQSVGGLPLGCFLLATRLEVNSTPDPNAEDTALILLRVAGQATLPNRADTEQWRFDAALRSIDSDQQWDAERNADQFTLNLLRHAGIRCRVLGTFRYTFMDGNWNLNFGADISNFYSGQGMKVFKPMGDALKEMVNFTKPTGKPHALSGSMETIGNVRYASTQISFEESRENVPVTMEPTDLLARRTALFGMSRSGKSNTIKTLVESLFKLRKLNFEKGRIGQLIFDVNGEYCNDNPQDEGCLRNISQSEVVTYGLFTHPHDPKRRLIKINFFGENVSDWSDQDAVNLALNMVRAGKSVIDDHLSGADVQYVKNFRATSLDTPDSLEARNIQTRYRRTVCVYRAILYLAGFTPPAQLREAWIGGLFSKELRDALEQYGKSYAARTLANNSVSWDDFSSAIKDLHEFILGAGRASYNNFNSRYRQSHDGKDWADDSLRGLLSILDFVGGVNKIREVRNRHDPIVRDDYAEKIIDELINGNLVIVDQSIGAPEEVKITSERVMWELFNRQKDAFTNPKRNDQGEIIRDDSGNIVPPPDVIVYVEEAHNLLPAKDADLDSIWARCAKEGSKFRIGLVYSTQEPSSILSNILKNTDNWFVAHLNNQDETRELRKYYDFDLFVDQILKVPDTGFVRMRCLSNPFIVPVQIKKFVCADYSDSQ